MKTENIHLQFKKGENHIYLEGNNVETQLSFGHESIDGEIFIEIPALNISISTFKADINSKVNEAVVSFINFRLKKEGIEKFIRTMLELGFDVKQNENNNRRRYSSVRSKDRSVSNNKFALAC